MVHICVFGQANASLASRRCGVDSFLNQSKRASPLVSHQEIVQPLRGVMARAVHVALLVDSKSAGLSEKPKSKRRDEV